MANDERAMTGGPRRRDTSSRLAAFLEGLRQHALVEPLAGFFSAYRVEEPTAGLFRARQLQAVLRLAPATMFANALNAAIIVASFWGAANRAFLLLWATAVAAVVARGLRTWQRSQRGAARRSASRRAMRRAIVHASVLAALWALVPLVLFPSSDGARQLLAAIIASGMMGAGGFALATTPAAGTAWVLILGAASEAALFLAGVPLAWPIGSLVLIYAGVVIAGVWSTARLFGARLIGETEAERQNEVIGLLLRDFEEHASDVLWEVDAEARLCHVSSRLESLFARPVAELTSAPLPDLLQKLMPAEDASTSQIEALRRHLELGTPFRDLVLAIALDGGTRWWSLTAKPLTDAGGRVTGWRGVASDITEAHRARRQLRFLAHFDPLTGLANRHQLRTELGELLARGYGTPQCAVLYLDLDHFKAVNDTLGHAAGDELLKEVAKRLQAGTRRTDTVARLAGDEFAIILREVSSAEEAEHLTRRLLESLEAPCEVQGTRVPVRVSIGVAIVPAHGSDVDSILNHADLALYAAKSGGRGQFRLFAPEMATRTRRRLLIEQQLRDALERGELSIACQPQVDLASSRVTGFEALLRWRNPQLGEVSPAEFIPVAEDTGLIRAIGDWVLMQACREAAGWPLELTVSVNVSAVQAMSPDLYPAVQLALQGSGLAARRLELEITESIFLNETEATMANLRALHDAGVRITLDDFGAGYTSLAHLWRFPFDTLKIDRSFVHELMINPDLRAIVTMIVGLASSLRMKTVAEGVEEWAQVTALAGYGCDGIQGFLVARPMPVEEVAAFLARWSERHPPVGGGLYTGTGSVV